MEGDVPIDDAIELADWIRRAKLIPSDVEWVEGWYEQAMGERDRAAIEAMF